jgi:O-antigen ligase
MSHYSGHDPVTKNAKKLPWGLFLFLFIIFYFATPYDPFFTIREPITAELMVMQTDKGDLGRRISLVVLGLFGLYNILRTRKDNIRLDFHGMLIIGYIFWAIVSISWSDEKIMTFRKIVILAMLLIGAGGIAMRYSIRDISYFAFFSGVTTIIIGIISETYLGTFHPFDMSYRFSGTIYPNTQGGNCAILAIASYSLSKTQPKWKSVFNILTIFALVFLFLTKSRASFAGALFALSVYWVITSSRDRKLAFLAITISLGCILVFIFDDNLFTFINKATYVGRDTSDLSTLALRIPLWQECMRYITQQPVQGFGYGSFWTAHRLLEFSRTQGWAVGQSHSGYIEIVLGLGIVGLLSYLTILFVGVKRALQEYLITSNRTYVFCFSIILFFCVDMFFENINEIPFLINFLCITLILKMAFLNIESIRARKVALKVNS